MKRKEQPEVCELCNRNQKLYFHHLIPRTTHTNKWFKKNFDLEDMRTRGLYVCKDCHRHIHISYDEKTLGRYYNTREALLKDEKIRRFVEWVKKRGE